MVDVKVGGGREKVRDLGHVVERRPHRRCDGGRVELAALVDGVGAAVRPVHRVLGNPTMRTLDNHMNIRCVY